MKISKTVEIAGTTIVLSVLLGSVGHPAEPKDAAAELTGVTASLVYDEDGMVDDRDLTSGKLALWNTPIGEGDAGRPSTSMFAIVRVKRSNSSARLGELAVTLRVWAQASGRLIFHERAVVPPVVKDRVTVPFLIRGTGCEPLRVEAGIAGVRVAVQRTINFKCGS
jgi:hypothetical protein